MNEKAINLTKRKLSVLIAGRLCFVGIGLWMLFQDSAAAKLMPPGLQDATATKALAVICIVFFGACAAIGVAKMFDQRPRPVFSSAGLSAERFPDFPGNGSIHIDAITEDEASSSINTFYTAARLVIEQAYVLNSQNRRSEWDAAFSERMAR